MTNNPLELRRVVDDAGLRNQLEAAFDILHATSAGPGGLTIHAKRDQGNDDRPRALVYCGPLHRRTEDVLRPILERAGFDLSHIRNFDRQKNYQTATADQPYGY